MRKKLNPEDKRSKIIGIKVKPETYKKLCYIADMEAIKVSSYINELIERNIKIVTETHKINWEEALKEGRDTGDQ